MQVVRMLCFALIGTILGIGGGVAWSLHDTVTNGNNMFGHWFPALVTAVVGAIIGLMAGSIFGLAFHAYRLRQMLSKQTVKP